MANRNELLKISDQELILKIKEDSRYLSLVHKECKSASILFLRKYSKGLRHIELDDVFSESCIKLYENIIYKNLELINNSSLQTYLNGICLNQLRSIDNKELDINGNIKIKKKLLNYEDKEKYNETIEEDDRKTARNSNYNITNPDWLPDNTFEDEESTNVTQKNAIKAALRKMKSDGGHCAELLVLFWWRKRSMKELTEIYSYKNELTTKNQKAKCQKRLKVIMQKEL